MNHSNQNHVFNLCLATLMFFAGGCPMVFATEAPTLQDNVIFSFATVGDSRYDKKETDATAEDKIWQQNSKALSRIIREVHSQKPNALFFNGDMIMAYTTNQAELDREYAYWRGMVADLMEESTYVVPIPGNHEVQIKFKPRNISKSKDAGEEDVLKIANPECETAWRRNMGDLIIETNLWRNIVGAPVEAWDANNKPTLGGPDGIITDQRQLTYSFDCKGIHFTMINTDAAGQDSHAPVNWLEQDLKAAKVRGCKTFFIYGHKMAYTYHFNPAFKAKGLDAFPDNAFAFWKLVNDYHATYFCGHEHIYHAMQPGETQPATKADAPWQVIVGSGGSPFEAKPGMSTNPNDRKYAWAFVQVHASGRVDMEARGFDEHYGPTETIEKIELHPAQ